MWAELQMCSLALLGHVGTHRAGGASHISLERFPHYFKPTICSFLPVPHLAQKWGLTHECELACVCGLAVNMDSNSGLCLWLP